MARSSLVTFVCLFGHGKVFDNHFSFVPLLFCLFSAFLTVLCGKVFDIHFCLFDCLDMARCLTDRSPLFGCIQSNKVSRAASLWQRNEVLGCYPFIIECRDSQ